MPIHEIKDQPKKHIDSHCGQFPKALLGAIETVHSGLRVWDDEASRKVENWTFYPTDRQRQTLLELANAGGTNREIGARLGIGEKAVAGHIQASMDELNKRTRVELAIWVRENMRRLPWPV
jgi:DNA-binding NarL/FixJ family response regulator